MLLRRIKPFLGVLFVLLSLAGLYFWETSGREAFTTEEVLMTQRSIAKGEVITGEMLKPQGVLKENKAEGVLTAEEASRAIGKIAACDISANSQITKATLIKPDSPGSELSNFTIQEDWILSRSASLRKGDRVEIYSEDMKINLGKYEISYVLDSDDRLVENTSGTKGSSIWDRDTGTGIIASVEIMSGIQDYEKIRAYVYGKHQSIESGAEEGYSYPVKGLILVQVNE